MPFKALSKIFGNLGIIRKSRSKTIADENAKMHAKMREGREGH